MEEMLMMPRIGDQSVLDRAVKHTRDENITLPRFAEMASPSGISEARQAALSDVPMDEPHPLNLFRINWFNDHQGKSLLNQQRI